MTSFSSRFVAQARAAIDGGRPELAEELIAELRFTKPHAVVGLLREIARGYAFRGRKHLLARHTDAAWQDLAAGESLNTDEPTVAELRDDLYRHGLADCRAALDAGDAFRVLGLAQTLRDRRCNHPQLAKLEETAQDWVTAREMADRGDFALARQTLDGVRKRLGFLPLGMEFFQTDVSSRQARFAQSFAELAKAVGENRLDEAMKHADEALAAAPSHRAARQYRDDVWSKLRPDTHSYTPLESKAAPPSSAGMAERSSLWRPTTAPHSSVLSSREAPAMSLTGVPKRFYLWVDGGGGYLVCTGTHVTIGQAAADAPIDIPIFADLAKVHATLSRDAEGFVLESSRGAMVNGKAVTRAALKPGDRISLGSTCQLAFDQPSPLSPTARLDLVSGHRFQTAVDAILLMADVLIMGPGDEPHVPLSSKEDVSLYRGAEGLSIRCPGRFRVDTFQFQDRANLRLPANIVGDGHGFTFHLEPAGRN
ncbi:MAG: FHA domain-containing protein [Gemmataceae bacterium]